MKRKELKETTVINCDFCGRYNPGPDGWRLFVYGDTEVYVCNDSMCSSRDSLIEARENATKTKQPFKCAVFGCTNHSDEGVFVGDTCYLCHIMITEGKPYISSNNFIYQLYLKTSDRADSSDRKV